MAPTHSKHARRGEQAAPTAALAQKGRDWLRAMEEVGPEDLADGVLTTEDKDLHDYLRANSDVWWTQLAEPAIRKLEAESEICAQLSQARWKSAQPHVQATSGHLNAELWRKCCDEYGWKDVHLREHIYEGFELDYIQGSTGAFQEKKVHAQDEFDDSTMIPDLKNRPRSDFNRPAPLWQEKHLIGHAISEYDDMAARGEVEEISQHRAVQTVSKGGYVNYCHTIDQSSPERPDKKRKVIHYEKPNDVAGKMPEYIKLPSHATAIMSAAYCQTAVDFSQFTQTKKDISETLQAAADKSEVFLGKRNANLDETDRIIDQVLASAQQALTETYDVPKPGRIQISAIVDDFSGAYEQLACKRREDNICAVWDPTALGGTGSWRYFLSPTMNFGARASVHAWGRVAAPVIHLMRKLFKIPYYIYVDDAFAFVPQSIAQQVRDLYRRVVACFGLKLSTPKSYEGQRPTLLGCDYDVSDPQKVHVHLATSKQEKLKRRVRDAIGAAEAGSLNQLMLSQLVGSLNFLVVATKFSLMRAALSPLYKHVGESSKSIKVTGSEVKRTLYNIRDMVDAYQGFTLSTDDTPDVVFLFTDASEGESELPQLGGVLSDPKNKLVLTFSETVPEEMVKKHRALGNKKGIAAYESYALIAALETWKRHLCGRKVIVLNDNQSVVYSLLKGSSSDNFVRVAAQHVFNYLAAHAVMASIRWVPSAHNISDGLTRDDLKRTLYATIDRFCERNSRRHIECSAASAPWHACFHRARAITMDAQSARGHGQNPRRDRA